MPLETKKKEKESTQGLIRRFSKGIKKSGILKEARKRRFFKKPLSDRAKKEAAIRRNRLREEYNRKEKLGLNKDKQYR
jgi:ribosomal protein S21